MYELEHTRHKLSKWFSSKYFQVDLASSLLFKTQVSAAAPPTLTNV